MALSRFKKLVKAAASQDAHQKSDEQPGLPAPSRALLATPTPEHTAATRPDYLVRDAPSSPENGKPCNFSAPELATSSASGFEEGTLKSGLASSTAILGRADASEPTSRPSAVASSTGDSTVASGGGGVTVSATASSSCGSDASGFRASAAAHSALTNPGATASSNQMLQVCAPALASSAVRSVRSATRPSMIAPAQPSGESPDGAVSPAAWDHSERNIYGFRSNVEATTHGADRIEIYPKGMQDDAILPGAVPVDAPEPETQTGSSAAQDTTEDVAQVEQKGSSIVVNEEHGVEIWKSNAAECGRLKTPKPKRSGDSYFASCSWEQLHDSINIFRGKIKEGDVQKRKLCTELMEARRLTWEHKQEADKARQMLRDVIVGVDDGHAAEDNSDLACAPQSDTLINPMLQAEVQALSRSRPASSVSTRSGSQARDSRPVSAAGLLRLGILGADTSRPHSALPLSGPASVHPNSRPTSALSGLCGADSEALLQYKACVKDLVERKEEQLRQVCTALADARALAGMFWRSAEDRLRMLQQFEAQESRGVMLSVLANHSAGEVFLGSCNRFARMRTGLFECDHELKQLRVDKIRLCPDSRPVRASPRIHESAGLSMSPLASAASLSPSIPATAQFPALAPSLLDVPRSTRSRCKTPDSLGRRSRLPQVLEQGAGTGSQLTASTDGEEALTTTKSAVPNPFELGASGSVDAGKQVADAAHDVTAHESVISHAEEQTAETVDSTFRHDLVSAIGQIDANMREGDNDGSKADVDQRWQSAPSLMESARVTVDSAATPQEDVHGVFGSRSSGSQAAAGCGLSSYLFELLRSNESASESTVLEQVQALIEVFGSLKYLQSRARTFIAQDYLIQLQRRSCQQVMDTQEVHGSMSRQLRFESSGRCHESSSDAEEIHTVFTTTWDEPAEPLRPVFAAPRPCFVPPLAVDMVRMGAEDDDPCEENSIDEHQLQQGAAIATGPIARPLVQVQHKGRPAQQLQQLRANSSPTKSTAVVARKRATVQRRRHPSSSSSELPKTAEQFLMARKASLKWPPTLSDAARGIVRSKLPDSKHLVYPMRPLAKQ